jgi:nucleotide-binding universal stress UspA family protein
MKEGVMNKKIETILIGTSLTEASDTVVRGGMNLARSVGAKAHVVHAYSPPMTYSGSPFIGEVPLTEVIKAERAVMQRKIDSQMERLGIQRSELAGVYLNVGPAHRLLIETAQAIHADLVVVGATEAPRLSRVFGSTADRVVRKASCPVLVVRGELPMPPRRVLLPVDLSPLSADAYELGLGVMAQITRAAASPERVPELEAFFVVVEPEGRAAVEPVPVMPENGAAKDELSLFLTAHGKGLESAALPVAARVETGFVDTAILDRIEQWGPDLVILGTHGRGGFERFLLGSVASTVVRDGWTNVLVIPPSAARQVAAPPAEVHAVA